MFGAYELQLPSSWQEKMMNSSSHQKQGSVIGVAIMGALSALIVSPCVSAPLAGALVYIAQTGEQLRGAVALYGLGLGMGVPLFIAGVGGARLLPKAGAWMDKVKHVFGFGLIAVAITLLNRLLPGPVGLALWGVLALAFAQFLLQLHLQSAWQYFLRAAQWTLQIIGVLYIVGALSGNDDPLHPVSFGGGSTSITSAEKVDPHALFKPIKTVADVEREVAAANAAGKTVMLDFFADWCVACFEFAKYTFPTPSVQAQLSNTVLLQADVTANDEADLALLEKYAIKGLPSILFFDKTGNELTQQRVTGFMKADAFADHVKQALGQP
jgi:thiol:disulfide interchange protein DsbD